MIRPVRLSVALVGLLAGCSILIAQPEAPKAADDRAVLVEGVQSIGFPGLPGTVIAFGEKAFPIVAGVANRQPALVVAGSHLGKGRVVVFGHEGFFTPETLGQADTRRLVENALRWAGGKGGSVAVVGMKGTAKALEAAGIKVIAVAGGNWVDQASRSSVVLVKANAIQAGDVAALRRYVENGGGLITGLPGWGWEQVNPGKTLARDSAAQKLLAAAGLGLASDTLTRPTNGVLTTGEVPSAVLVRSAQTAAEQALAGKESSDLGVAQATLMRAMEALPAENARPIREQLRKALSTATTAPPTPTRPLTKKDGAARLVTGLRNRLVQALPAEEVPAAPGADAFPGRVPSDARRVEKTVNFTSGAAGYVCDGVGTSANSSLWFSTGLYAAPGETITVEIPPGLVGKGLQVQIGCHTDTLWHLETWRRSPEIVRRVALAQAKTKAANAFGGLVYLVAPVKANLGGVRATITGAVEAPLYVHGKTTKEEWAKVRAHPGPWAEFASDKVILTVPSEDARRVDDPIALMNFWDRVLDACADLTTVGHQRGRAERLVHDVQISAGYMHSGYPIMGPLNEGKRALDVDRIQREGAWGYFHELGHNHQGRAWTFDGTVEVTCNLYSIYVTETLCPKAPLHDAIQPASIQRHARKYRAAGAKFDDWKKDPFVALIVYKQMQEAFGWETFKKVFAEYRKTPARQLPRGDAEERDQWLTRFSTTCGKSLVPAFAYWGIPVSEAAKRSVADLPIWDFPDATK